MGQHKAVRLRACSYCGAQETTDADGMARHVCKPDQLGKQHAWRMRMRRQGRCTKCGKKCLPYTECAEHRFARRLRYVLNRGVKYGLFVSPQRGYYAMGDENAKVGVRGWYKTDPGGRAPRGFYAFTEALLRQRGQPVRDAEIVSGFVAHQKDRAARGHLEVSEDARPACQSTEGATP